MQVESCASVKAESDERNEGVYCVCMSIVSVRSLVMMHIYGSMENGVFVYCPYIAPSLCASFQPITIRDNRHQDGNIVLLSAHEI